MLGDVIGQCTDEEITALLAHRPRPGGGRHVCTDIALRTACERLGAHGLCQVHDDPFCSTLTTAGQALAVEYAAIITIGEFG